MCQKKISSLALSSFAEFADRLCALYNNLSQVKITPWDPDNTVHIDEIYTQLCWLRDDKKPGEKKNSQTTVTFSKGTEESLIQTEFLSTADQELGSLPLHRRFPLIGQEAKKNFLRNLTYFS